MEKCYHIKRCPFLGTDFEKAQCPAYAQKGNCWEYDWIAFYQSMPNCLQKQEWRQVMLTECPGCPVYFLRQEKLALMLSNLEKI